MASRRTIWLPALVVAVLFTANSIVPAAFANFYVDPNQITLESDYIAHNIEYTRRSVNIDDQTVSSRQFEAGSNISPAVVEQNQQTLDNVRLWDPGALKDNLQQQQEIRLYYQFHDEQ